MSPNPASNTLPPSDADETAAEAGLTQATLQGTIQTFGKYQFVKQIGEGGFATVHLALDDHLGRYVALKLLRETANGYHQRFVQEAQMIAQLEHFHIIPIYEAGELQGQSYIAMKYIEQGSLREYLKQKRRLSWAETEPLLRQILDALAFVHSKGVVHRDLKPANILLYNPSYCYLTDFGVALQEGRERLTLTGGVTGTPYYIPPEVWAGEAADARADIYALGCILYELLQGRKLFAKEQTADTTFPQIHAQGAVIEPLPEDVPPVLGKIIAKATHRERQKRYQTVAEFVADLDKLVGGSGVQPVHGGWGGAVPTATTGTAVEPLWQTWASKPWVMYLLVGLWLLWLVLVWASPTAVVFFLFFLTTALLTAQQVWLYQTRHERVDPHTILDSRQQTDQLLRQALAHQLMLLEETVRQARLQNPTASAPLKQLEVRVAELGRQVRSPQVGVAGYLTTETIAPATMEALLDYDDGLRAQVAKIHGRGQQLLLTNPAEQTALLALLTQELYEFGQQFHGRGQLPHQQVRQSL
jgi:hypothetical protein